MTNKKAPQEATIKFETLALIDFLSAGTIKEVMRRVRKLTEAIQNGEEYTPPDTLSPQAQAVYDAIAADIQASTERFYSRQEQATHAANVRWHGRAGYEADTIQPDATAAPPPTPPDTTTQDATAIDNMIAGVVRSVSALDVPNVTEPHTSAAQAGGNAAIPTRDMCEEYAAQCGYSKEFGAQFFRYNQRKGWIMEGKPVYDWQHLFTCFMESKTKRAQSATPAALRASNRRQSHEQRPIQSNIGRLHRALVKASQPQPTSDTVPAAPRYINCYSDGMRPQLE